MKASLYNKIITGQLEEKKTPLDPSVAKAPPPEIVEERKESTAQSWERWASEDAHALMLREILEQRIQILREGCENHTNEYSVKFLRSRLTETRTLTQVLDAMIKGTYGPDETHS